MDSFRKISLHSRLWIAVLAAGTWSTAPASADAAGVIGLGIHGLYAQYPYYLYPPGCRVGGGALDCSRAGLRPPLKLGVQFSRTQLSRKRSSLSGDGRDHRNQVHKPVLTVELTAWQRSPTASSATCGAGATRSAAP